jgi:hypothetical protein
MAARRLGRPSVVRPPQRAGADGIRQPCARLRGAVTHAHHLVPSHPLPGAGARAAAALWRSRWPLRGRDTQAYIQKYALRSANVLESLCVAVLLFGYAGTIITAKAATRGSVVPTTAAIFKLAIVVYGAVKLLRRGTVLYSMVSRRWLGAGADVGEGVSSAELDDGGGLALRPGRMPTSSIAVQLTAVQSMPDAQASTGAADVQALGSDTQTFVKE